MRYIISGITFLLISSNLYAQLKVTDLKLATEVTPGSHYLMPNELDSKLVEGHNKTSAKTYQSRFNLAINFNLSTKSDSASGAIKSWNLKVNSDHMLLNNTGYSDNVFPSSLHASSVALTRLKTLKNNWAVVGLLTVGVNSDYSQINLNDVFIFAGAVWAKQFSSKFSLGTGVMIHNSFGIPLPWPLITANWQMGGKYRLNIDAPDEAPGLAYNVSFRYVRNPRSEFAVFFRPSNMSYDVDLKTDNKRLLNYWQIPVGLEMKTHFKHLDLSYHIDLMAVRSFIYAEKKLEKMFSKNPAYLLAPKFSFGMDLKFKL